MATVEMQSRFCGWRAAGMALLAFSTTTLGSSAQTFATLATFNRANGLAPVSVVQGFDGNFYGTTTGGGPYRSGTVFKITSSGALTTLYSSALWRLAPTALFLNPDLSWPLTATYTELPATAVSTMQAHSSESPALGN